MGEEGFINLIEMLLREDELLNGIITTYRKFYVCGWVHY
jgi:hypothetical protein